MTHREAVRLIRYAIDEGITFMDNAWEYAEGRSEARMGEAIADRRDDVLLMTKVCARDRDGALRQLEDSLRRLRTDRIDLWQFHEVNYGNDHEWIFGPGGAIEAARIALESGKVRYVGFTGHKDPAFHLSMLGHDYPWASVQMPVNVLDTSFKSFTKGVLPEATKRGIGVIGMKSLGGSGQLITEAGLSPEELIGYALSQPRSSNARDRSRPTGATSTSRRCSTTTARSTRRSTGSRCSRWAARPSDEPATPTAGLLVPGNDLPPFAREL